MPRISEADIAYIRDHSDIEAVVGDVVRLKRSGGGNLKGLCPFHDEKSPSFNVNIARGTYHCFGCGEGGDAINFVQETQGSSFVEAVTYLADRLGMKLTAEQSPNGTHAPPRHEGDRNRLLDANRAAAAWFAAQLTTTEGSPAAAFLADRGFTHEDALRFGCGYAPDGWHTTHHHLNSQGFTDDELVQAGLLNRGDRGPYDAFRGRLIFPIRSHAGDVIGFGARRLRDDDTGPKYLNTGETLLYRKTNVLYGLDTARAKMREDNSVLIVEGYTDVMACHLSGATNAVATCGTAFGEAHAKMLNRMMGGEGRIVYLFDGDDAGQKAALKAYELDSVFGHRTSAAVAPDGLDPCELRQRSGDQAVLDLVASARPLFTLVLDDAIGSVSLTDPETQRDAIERAAPILAAINDPVLRNQHTRRVALLTGTTSAVVAAAATRAGRGERAPSPQTPPIEAPSPAVSDGPSDAIDDIPMPPITHPDLIGERMSLRLVLQRPETRETWKRLVEPADYQHPAYRRLAANLDDPHPVLERVRQGLLVEALPPAHDADSSIEMIFADVARAAIPRRLAAAVHMLTAQVSDEDRTKIVEHQQRLHRRLASLLDHGWRGPQ